MNREDGGAIQGATMMLGGERLVADPSGVLWWPTAETLIVSDLHLEKGSSFARRGILLPPYDTGATLARLAQTIRRLRPARVVALGDSFHDAEAAARLSATDAEHLRRLVATQDWIWIAGNHDPEPDPSLGGRVVPESGIAGELVLGALTFRHEALIEAPTGIEAPNGVETSLGAGAEISGHFHPKASVQVHGRRLTCRCFVSDGRRLLLPAFGAYAGGLDLADPAFLPLFPAGGMAYLIGQRRVTALPFTRASLPGYRRGAKP